MQRAIVKRSKKTRSSSRPRLSTSAQAVGQYAEDAWSLAQRTATGLNAIRKLINIETKIIDTQVSNTAFDRTGIVYPITQVAQGLDYTNRVGDSIKLQHIEFHARLFQNAVATQSVMRVIIFRDLDGYGTAPTTADVLEVVGTAPVTLTPYKWLNRERFSILFDEFFTVNAAGDTAVPIFYSASHAGHVRYLTTTAATAANGKGSIYVTFVSDEVTNTPNFAFYSRVTFTDD